MLAVVQWCCHTNQMIRFSYITKEQRRKYGKKSQMLKDYIRQTTNGIVQSVEGYASDENGNELVDLPLAISTRAPLLQTITARREEELLPFT